MNLLCLLISGLHEEGIGGPFGSGFKIFTVGAGADGIITFLCPVGWWFYSNWIREWQKPEGYWASGWNVSLEG